MKYSFLVLAVIMSFSCKQSPPMAAEQGLRDPLEEENYLVYNAVSRERARQIEKSFASVPAIHDTVKSVDRMIFYRMSAFDSTEVEAEYLFLLDDQFLRDLKYTWTKARGNLSLEKRFMAIRKALRGKIGRPIILSAQVRSDSNLVMMNEPDWFVSKPYVGRLEYVVKNGEEPKIELAIHFE